MSDERIFRTLVHALRHDPWKYGLELDEEGFAAIEDLVTGLRFDRYDWALLESVDVVRVLRELGAGRIEHRGSHVRARYGHSIELGSLPPMEAPPDILFHGTTDLALPLILRDGLKPMDRRFVHLTSDHGYAYRVANARQSQAVVIINTARAANAGLHFRRSTEHIWLTEHIKPNCLLAQSKTACS